MSIPLGFRENDRTAAVECVASLLYPEGFGAAEIVRVERFLGKPPEGESAERLAARAYVVEELVLGFAAKWVHRTIGFSPWAEAAMFSLMTARKFAIYIGGGIKKQQAVALRERNGGVR